MGDSEPLGSDSEIPSSGSGATEADTTEATTVPTVPADSGSTSSDSTAPTSEPIAPPPAGEPVKPMVKALQPLSDAVNDMADVIGSVPATVAGLRTSPTPIADAITSVQSILTSMVDTMGTLGQVPADLYALLGVPTHPAPPLIGDSGALGAAKATAPAHAPLFGPLAGQVPNLAFPPPAGSTSLFGTMAPRPTLGTVATTRLKQPLAVSGAVPLKTVPPTDARSIFEHVLDAVLVPASLTALAALALPGLGGLLVVCAAGMRVGYRQAKARLALRSSGIARFAGPGPLGVVRSGSLVVLRQRARGPRTVRAVCPEASRSARALEPVA